MQERLQKFLARAGVASRRKAEELMLTGKVKVNGKVTKVLGTVINPDKDKVEFEGRVVKLETEPIIYALHKPIGVVSTVRDELGNQTVVDLLPKGARLYPAGRLDKNSSGLLLVTNDGELANLLTHPRYEHEKEYDVIVLGNDPKNLERLTDRFRLDGKLTQPMAVTHKPVRCGAGKWRFRVVLKEGKKRQIRRIADMLGYRVVSLLRLRIGKLKLGTLEPGQWRIVKKADII